MRIWLMLALLPALSACNQSPASNPAADMAVTASSASESSDLPIAAWVSETSVADDAVSSGQVSSAGAIPADVQAFTEKRDECDHWRGEEPYDDDRAKEIRNAINDTCTGTDRKLAVLRRKYQDQPYIMQALADYEDKIEN